MALASCLGFPNIGANLELVHQIKGFLNGEILQETLEIFTRKTRQQKWINQKNAGIDFIPSNDFFYFDFVLDTAVLFGVIPERFQWNSSNFGYNLLNLFVRLDILLVVKVFAHSLLN